MEFSNIERWPIEDRESWLLMRRQNINASEVATVCGEGAFGSLAELYAEKKGMRPPLIDSGVLRRGRWGEAAVFEALQDERPEWNLTRAKIYLRSPELRLGCTPDGYVLAPDRLGRGVVQAKTVARTVFKRRWLDDSSAEIDSGAASPPVYYVLQTLTEMMLSGCQWGILAAVVQSEFDSVLRLFEVERDDELEERILANVDRFWREHLDPEIMPPFVPQRDEALIKALYPTDSGAVLDLQGDNRAMELVELLTEWQAAHKRAETACKEIKTELQAKLGEASIGILADGRALSWRVQHRRGYTVKPSNSRVFKILKAYRDDDDDDD